MPPRPTTRGARIELGLTKHERDVILERTFIDPEMDQRLRSARRSGASLIVRLTIDDVDDLAGHVAAEANHCAESRPRHALEAVHAPLVDLEARFTEAEADGHAPAQRPKRMTAKQGQYLAFIYYYGRTISDDAERGCARGRC